MEIEILDEIQKLTKIIIKQEDWIGKGSYAQVYHYKIKNKEIAIKCFKI